MADEVARKQQYEYNKVCQFIYLLDYLSQYLNFQNSNLVLQVDYNLTDRRNRDEPTGEVMPLNRDILTGVKMGDKFQRAAAPAEKKNTAKKLVLQLFFRCK